MNRSTSPITFAVIWLLSQLPGVVQGDDQQQREFFESRIRPVLIKHCYECHSADSKEIKGSLRLDSAKALLQGGDSGPAIVVGKPEESPLIEALRYEGVEMPPAGRLPETIVHDFEQWVKAGAFDPREETLADNVSKTARTINVDAERQFWAFQPVVRHRRPAIADTAWPVSDIDAFVLAKLEAAGLRPMPDADKRALVRRLYFDLTGLPPSPQDVHGFLQDDSDGALERLVDRLLESRQFGVHWGRHWLDVARYADSNGGDFNATFHNAWKYRDYVVNSFNNDKSFDQFIREQIAGDLLPNETDEDRTQRIVATGFLMVGAKMLSERDKLKLTMDVVDEQVNTVGQAFMGLTLGCARCHDHKFDPIPTRDYYALAGIFRSTRTLQGESQEYVSTWPRRSLPADAKHVAAVKANEASQKEVQSDIKQATQLKDRLTKQLKAVRAGESWLVVDDADAKRIGFWKASTYNPSFYGKGYIHDDKSEKGEKWVEFTVKVSRSASYDVQLSYTHGGNRAAKVPVSVKHADGEVEINLDQRKRPPIEDLFASVGQFRFNEDRPGIITVATRGTEGYVIADAVRLVQVDDSGNDFVNSSDTGGTFEPKSENDICPLVAGLSSELKAVEEALKEQEAQLSKLKENAPKPLPRAIAVDEADQMVDCRICIRGEHENLGPLVPRGVLQVVATSQVPTFPTEQSGRLELANWLASQEHPLTARVFVNRIWHHLIGQGIVASVDNFGQLGERPTHPELLDRLAADFMKDGWSVKWVIRRIVLSRVYRMSSRHDEQSWVADPANRLLWRANRRRMTAESIRDSMLAISGQLNLSPAGSPVEGLGVLVTQNNAEQKEFKPQESLHRSLYLPMIRAEIPEILLAFDIADPDLVTGRRSVTNVPAQALLLLNSPFVMAQAEKTAERIRAATNSMDDPTAQITGAYELVLSREPTESEFTRAAAFLEETERTDSTISPLAQLVHTMFASTEFRMLN